ncbi:WhiB family transcriptional regulator [Streptosporangium sp. OZ121]|uniref:WhiB family transcriptional regulator n=1 Tax=Streptosporangium sp. OZ121 TaxID=3444183 RepID=UPI003F7B33B6
MSLRSVETAQAALVRHADHTELPCHADPDLWFSDLPEELEIAKGLCRGCRVRTNCLTRALQREEPCGVWGGELIRRGTVVPRKLPRGRPRKNSPVRANRPERVSEPALPSG